MNSEKHFRNFRGETSEKLTKYFVKSNSKLAVCLKAVLRDTAT